MRLLARHMAPGNRIEQLQQALDIARQRDDATETAFCQWRLAEVIGYAGDYARGLELAQAALAIYDRLDDRYGRSRALHDIAFFYGNQGHIDRFIDLTRQSIALKREIGDRIGMANGLYNLGASELLAGNLDAAEEYYQESLAISREMRDLQRVSINTATRSAIAYLRGELEITRNLAEEALDIATDIQNPACKSFAQVALSLVKLAHDEDAATVKAWCEESAGINTSNRTFLVFATHGLTLATISLGEFEAARGAQRALLQMAMVFGGAGALAFCLPTAALLVAESSDLDQAAALIGLADSTPDSPKEWFFQSPLVKTLRQTLIADLGDDTYQAAYTRGTGLDLKQVTVDLLQTLD
jgi:tetratricopeptide (TPR) repeat protein